MLSLVDDHKKEAMNTGRGPISDRLAVGELIYKHAPNAERASLKERLDCYLEKAETPYARKHALTKAVTDVEPDRFQRLLELVVRARHKERDR